MATFEEYKLAADAAHNLEGLRRDMRSNANGYIRDLNNRSLTELATVMTQDANEYLRRIGWVTRLTGDATLRAKLVNGLTALGLTVTEGQNSVAELRTAAQNLRDVVKTTSLDITAAANAVLAAVSSHETVW